LRQRLSLWRTAIYSESFASAREEVAVYPMKEEVFFMQVSCAVVSSLGGRQQLSSLLKHDVQRRHQCQRDNEGNVKKQTCLATASAMIMVRMEQSPTANALTRFCTGRGQPRINP